MTHIDQNKCQYGSNNCNGSTKCHKNAVGMSFDINLVKSKSMLNKKIGGKHYDTND
ncbi:MAG: hypothetical protein ACQES1_02965 [Bacteroidota bacterium]